MNVNIEKIPDGKLSNGGLFMKKYYSIGETATLLGVSTQTLRYYDKIGLLSPGCVDENNGYRYYCYNQFHIIDRIRYLQRFDLSLEEIKNIMQNGKVDKLLVYLQHKRIETERELCNLSGRLNDIDWYINYFTYMDKENITDYIYRIQQPARYIIKCPCYYKEPLPNMEIRLAQVKSRKEYARVKFHRQYGYKLSADSLFQQKFNPTEYFIYLSGKPELDHSLYEELRAGEYLCFRTQLLHENWNPDPLKAFFSNRKLPTLVLALEFEDNLLDWSDAWYELQILL